MLTNYRGKLRVTHKLNTYNNNNNSLQYIYYIENDELIRKTKTNIIV